MQVTDIDKEEKGKKSQSSHQVTNDELPLHRRMINLEKIIAFQTQESIEEM